MRSAPGCIIASPSYPRATPGTNQDYVHNWTRDAALTAMELEAQGAASDQFARDYVTFAALCLAAAKAAEQFDYACFNVDGSLRSIPTWSRQSDGPALQTREARAHRRRRRGAVPRAGLPAGAAARDDKVAQLRDAGDAILEAVVFHSDHLELGEQFDAWTGYGRSVRNLTWSYSAFLSAVRARAAVREV